MMKKVKNKMVLKGSCPPLSKTKSLAEMQDAFVAKNATIKEIPPSFFNNEIRLRCGFPP
jgi:hypothetical protein